MVVIRLSRMGTHKSPFYYLAIADRRAPRDGRYIERIGFYNPMARGAEVYLRINQERLAHWLQLGAQPSDRVNFLIKQFNKIGERTGTEYKALVAAQPKKKAKAAKEEAKPQEAAA